MRRTSRRRFLSSASVALGAMPLVRAAGGSRPRQSGADPAFRHGVASGDPLADRVMLWTRVTVSGGDTAMVRWVVARDPKLAQVVARGEGQTGAWRDFTVKVDVGGLRPGTMYDYRFETEADARPSGARGPCRRRASPASASAWCRARTIPSGTSMPTRRSPAAPTSTPSCTLVITSTSTRNAQIGGARPLA